MSKYRGLSRDEYLDLVVAAAAAAGQDDQDFVGVHQKAAGYKLLTPDPVQPDYIITNDDYQRLSQFAQTQSAE